jgi:hypothetical protein
MDGPPPHASNSHTCNELKDYRIPGDKRQLMFQDVTAKYCIYDKVPLKLMSFFVVVKGCVNFLEMTSVHKKRVFAR